MSDKAFDSLESNITEEDNSIDLIDQECETDLTASSSPIVVTKHKRKFPSITSTTPTINSEKRRPKQVTFGKITVERVESYKRYNRKKTKLNFEEIPEPECNCILI